MKYLTLERICKAGPCMDYCLRDGVTPDRMQIWLDLDKRNRIPIHEIMSLSRVHIKDKLWLLCLPGLISDRVWKATLASLDHTFPGCVDHLRAGQGLTRAVLDSVIRRLSSRLIALGVFELPNELILSVICEKQKEIEFKCGN